MKCCHPSTRFVLIDESRGTLSIAKLRLCRADPGGRYRQHSQTRRSATYFTHVSRISATRNTGCTTTSLKTPTHRLRLRRRPWPRRQQPTGTEPQRGLGRMRVGCAGAHSREDGERYWRSQRSTVISKRLSSKLSTWQTRAA